MAGMQPGPSGHADALRYARLYPATAALPVKPTDLVNFGEAVNFPLILGVVLVLFGAATLIHVLVVSVARRRRELGLLKAIGFVRRQVAAAVCWQATTVAAVGIVVGVPLGLIAGRLIWHAFATNLGVVPVVVFPVGAIVLLGAGVVLMANVLAAGPALVSARARAGVLLRTE
jgi:ABC-type antimicrobial peptide transport system permease subunit